MRILACTLAIALLLAASAGAQTVSTKGTLDTCHTGAGTLERYAVFAAQMGTIRGAKKLQVRFDLLQRLPGGGFQPIAAPGLGTWRSSTADIFRYRKQVTGLQAPAAYRAVVLFRWLSPKGAILKSARRTTKTCTQPDPGADVAVGSIRARRAGSGRAQYLVTVVNKGLADAGSFDVTLALGPDAQPRQTVESLGAGAATVVTFAGPACAKGESVTAQVDPDGTLDQTDRTNDQKVVDCPLS